VDIDESQRVMADLLVDPTALAAWELDPLSYARSRLSGSEAAMIAGLDRAQLRWAARAVEVKRRSADEAHARAHRRSAMRSAGAHDQAGGQDGPLTDRPSEPISLAPGVRVGLAYRMGLLAHVWQHLDLVEVWEHTIDGFVHAGEEGHRSLRTFAETAPVVLHSLGLSVASMAARQSGAQVPRIRDLIATAGADQLSDHLAYCRVDHVDLHFFVPPWRVQEHLELVVGNVDYLQDQLGARLILETIAIVLDPGGEMDYPEFTNEVVQRTGCGVLLDITNVLVNEANGLMSADRTFAALDLRAVTGVHLAGPAMSDGVLWDAHQAPVPDVDIEWLKRLLPCMPNCRTVVIERDERLQEAGEVLDDLTRVRAARDAVHASQASPIDR
jgi:uncharacterized protein